VPTTSPASTSAASAVVSAHATESLRIRSISNRSCRRTATVTASGASTTMPSRNGTYAAGPAQPSVVTTQLATIDATITPAARMSQRNCRRVRSSPRRYRTTTLARHSTVTASSDPRAANSTGSHTAAGTETGECAGGTSWWFMVTTNAVFMTSAATGTSAVTAAQRRPGSGPSGKTSNRIRNPTSCHGHTPAPTTATTSEPHQGAADPAVRPHVSTAGVATMNAASQASAGPTGPAGARTAMSHPSPSGTRPSTQTGAVPPAARLGPNSA
jgi:hypothetical protein